MTKPKRVALYARVSQQAQTTDNQRLELERIAEARGWTIVDTYRDHAISGAKFGKDRPELERLRKDAGRHRFDLLMAWSIDRIGRSTHEVTGFMAELDAIGVGQYYVQQALDTSTPHGKAMVQMAAVFAELERGMIRERVMAGLARARRKGTRSGKAIGRPKVEPKLEERIRAGLAKGTGILKLAKELGVGTSVVQRIKAEA
jgi:DNA invertase Pin-like site-specific DNA recombinase